MNFHKTTILAGLATLLITSCGQGTPKPGMPMPKQGKLTKSNTETNLKGLSQATFAAGCFWHEEALFESVKGVKEAVSGYAGGTTKNPSYEDIETGTTGHTETVNVYYDSSVISYPTLLKVFIEGQEDPTQVNGQGPDRGTQYRSMVFYRNAKEKLMAEEYINKINSEKIYTRPIAAGIAPMTVFWPAEDYHQDYVYSHYDNPYISNVSIPGIAVFHGKHPELIKPGQNIAYQH